MRVLYVAPNILLPGTNGGSTHVTEVVRALRREHEVLVLARHGSVAPQTVEIGGRLAPGPLRYLLPVKQLPKALWHARRFRPDVVYERFSAFGLGVMLGLALSAPVVAMVLDRAATHTTYLGADRLITTSPHLVPSRYRSKVERVTWGANTEMFRPDVDGTGVRSRLGLSARDFVVGYTGGFYHWHGLDTLIEAAARLRREPRARRFRYLLVGDGAERSRLEGRVRRLGLAPQVVFTGSVPYADVPRHIAACDVCVAPYDPSAHAELRRHGMFFDPLKVFEYLAMGKATITLDSANMRQLFVQDEHALLVEPGRVEPLVQALRRVATDAALRQRLGRSGRQLVAKRYSWEAHGRQLTRIFAELVAERGDDENRRRRPNHRQ